MVYPKEPVYDCEAAYELCISDYRSYLENNDCGKIVFMGDSTGGGLALGLAEALRDQGEICPEELILISPWVDVTMSNSDSKDYVALDPMLGIDGLRRMGEVWDDGLEKTDPRVSLIYGDLSGLGRVTLITGTWEVLYPDSLLLAEKLNRAGKECNLIVGERMIHCYPICPIPEAKAAQEAIWEAILRQPEREAAFGNTQVYTLLYPVKAQDVTGYYFVKTGTGFEARKPEATARVKWGAPPRRLQALIQLFRDLVAVGIRGFLCRCDLSHPFGILLALPFTDIFPQPAGLADHGISFRTVAIGPLIATQLRIDLKGDFIGKVPFLRIEPADAEISQFHLTIFTVIVVQIVFKK